MNVDDQLKNASSAPKPHDVLWLFDGNVVLATNTWLFKVHKGVLALQSSVFKDMFELAMADGAQGRQGDAGMEEASELYEGLPLVKLVGDKGEDVVHLLRAAYERQYYYRDDDDVSLDTVVALLTLSTKYDFKHIRRDVIKQVSKHYPMNLVAYDAVDDNDSMMFRDKRENCHFPLLVAAYMAHVDVLLPILYYACCSYSMVFILNAGRAAGSASPECIDTFLKGREKFGQAANELIAALPDTRMGGPLDMWCLNPEPCSTNAGYTYLSNLVGSSLSKLEGSSVVEDHYSVVCGPCSSSLTDSINGDREKIWADVPSYFGFPGWDVLQEKLNAII